MKHNIQLEAMEHAASSILKISEMVAAFNKHLPKLREAVETTFSGETVKDLLEMLDSIEAMAKDNDGSIETLNTYIESVISVVGVAFLDKERQNAKNAADAAADAANIKNIHKNK